MIVLYKPVDVTCCSNKYIFQAAGTFLHIPQSVIYM